MPSSPTPDAGDRPEDWVIPPDAARPAPARRRRGRLALAGVRAVPLLAALLAGGVATAAVTQHNQANPAAVTLAGTTAASAATSAPHTFPVPGEDDGGDGGGQAGSDDPG